MIIHEVWLNRTKPFGTAMNIQVQIAKSEELRPTLPQATEKQKWLLDLMQECWHGDPSLRPSFAEIVSIFIKANPELEGK